jgi:hypothetical protein
MYYKKMRGHFKAKAPFEDIVNENKVYTITSIRSLVDMRDSNENPKENIYIVNGLSESDYLNDLKNDVKTLVLIDDGGNYAYIPETYILSVPKVNGVLYQEKILIADMGALKTSYDLFNIISDVKDLIKSYTGVTPGVAVKSKSAETVLTYDESETLETQRDLEKGVGLNYKLKYEEALQRETKYKEQIAALECYIKEKISI